MLLVSAKWQTVSIETILLNKETESSIAAYYFADK